MMAHAAPEEWPTSTDICCWWCCHPFDTIPVPLPVSYDEKRSIFNVVGYFCSFGCAKAYNLNRLSIGRDRNSTLISLMKWKILHKDSRKSSNSANRVGVKTAPQRTTLKMFGGKSTIEEFREGLDVIVPSSEIDKVRTLIGTRDRVGTVFDPTLGFENKAVGGRVRSLEEAYVEIRDEGDEDEDAMMEAAFARVDAPQPREPTQRKPSKKAGPAVKNEDVVLESIRSGTAVKNQSYRLKRSMPLARENATLFNSMHIRVESGPS